MLQQQYGDDITAKSFNVDDVYDETSVYDKFIESVDASIRHSLRNYWATNAQADLTDIVFQAEPPLSIEKE